MKKRRGCFAGSTDKEDFGDESSRKGRGQSHMKKMKCLSLDNSKSAKKARVEYNEGNSKYLFDEDVVDALMLLSVHPDTQYSSPSLPIVYFRTRFRKEKNDKYLMSFFEKLMWSIDTEGLLKLNLDLIPFQEFTTRLSLPICPLLDFQLGSSTARFSQLLLMQQYGKIVSTWPKVYIEMLFVDNEVGLRYFLVEGCLKQAVAYIFVVLSLFCDTNKLGKSVDWQIPVCSVTFKLSCVQDLKKQHGFTFYCFSKLKYINWLHLDSVFQKHCLIAKKLPLPECTLVNIKALKGESNLSWESSQGSRRIFFKDIIPVGPTKSRKENVRQAPTCTVKHGMLPFALSYSAAPLSFRSLHLKLLMRSTLASVRLWECTLACPVVLRGKTCNSTTICCAVPKHCCEMRTYRRAGQMRTYGDTKASQRNLELLACNSNVLITLGDRCWRKSGMWVVSEFSDQNEWSLAVKFSGSTEYLHKVRHVFQTGSTNRYTRAMMWKGAKDWALEFPDRSQWKMFKEMYEECYNRNIRAAKNISIPGFRLLEECEGYTKKLPFTPSPSYIQQIENDIDMAMNPSKTLYDMDSEDEQWILKDGKSFQSQETSWTLITDGIFEKCMDMLEKFAYAQQRSHFTVAELENLMVGVVPSEVIIAIYHHWQQKRKRTGMPLIRQLQPPSWDRYHVKLQEWNRFMTKGKSITVCADEVKAPIVEKPAMFAFCLKPRGLEVPNNGSKCRSQKKVHAAGRRHANIGEQVREGIASYHRPGKRSRVQQQDMEFADWPSQKRHQSGLYPGKGNLHSGVRVSDELRMREASGAAKHAAYIAVLKQEKAKSLRLKADYAINVAASALMMASAIKASCPAD